MMRIECLFLFCLVMFACSQEEIPERHYPRVRTHPVTDISVTGAKFNGEILTAPDQMTFGFVFSETEDFTKSVDLAEVVRGYGVYQPQRVSQLVNRSMKPGVIYYVRAYASTSRNSPVDNGYKVYGNVVEFLSQGSKAPEIISIEPLTATWGDTILVRGENFAYQVSSNVVKFGMVRAGVAYPSPEKLEVIIPVDLKQKSSQISITFGVSGDVSTEFFTLLPPIINAQDAFYFDVGDVVTITGENFNSKHTRVTVGGVEAFVQSAGKEKVVFIVPPVDHGGQRELEVKLITGDDDLMATTYLKVRE